MRLICFLWLLISYTSYAASQLDADQMSATSSGGITRVSPAGAAYGSSADEPAGRAAPEGRCLPCTDLVLYAGGRSPSYQRLGYQVPSPFDPRRDLRLPVVPQQDSPYLYRIKLSLPAGGPAGHKPWSAYVLLTQHNLPFEFLPIEKLLKILRKCSTAIPECISEGFDDLEDLLLKLSDYGLLLTAKNISDFTARMQAPLKSSGEQCYKEAKEIFETQLNLHQEKINAGTTLISLQDYTATLEQIYFKGLSQTDYIAFYIKEFIPESVRGKLGRLERIAEWFEDLPKSAQDFISSHCDTNFAKKIHPTAFYKMAMFFVEYQKWNNGMDSRLHRVSLDINPAQKFEDLETEDDRLSDIYFEFLKESVLNPSLDYHEGYLRRLGELPSQVLEPMFTWDDDTIRYYLGLEEVKISKNPWGRERDEKWRPKYLNFLKSHRDMNKRFLLYVGLAHGGAMFQNMIENGYSIERYRSGRWVPEVFAKDPVLAAGAGGIGQFPAGGAGAASGTSA